MLVAAVLVGGGLAGCGGSAPVRPAPSGSASLASAGPSAAPAGTATSVARARAKTEPAAGTALGRPAASGSITVGDVNLVARSAVRRIAIYPSATADRPERTMADPLPAGGPLVFLVQERRADRLRVLLPIRPNQSQGWVRAADVKLARLDYRITVSVRAHELRLYRAGRIVLTAPVGLGKGTTPTPGGVFYIKELLRPSNPRGAYGPYAYGLSGYSDVLHEFVGGDGEIGIHGTDDPSSVGKDVSHGCIRMQNATITRLAGLLPLGTPVQLVA